MKTQSKNVLLVDDEEKLLETIARRMTLLGFQSFKATNGNVAIEIAKEHDMDIAIVDLQMPGMDGLVTITKLKEIHPHLKTVLLTGHGNNKIKQATEALDAGYFEKDDMVDFWKFIKTLNSGGQTVVIQPAVSSENPSNDISIYSTKAHSQTYHSDIALHQLIVGETEAILNLRKNIKRLAALDCPVLLLGEDGTGKEYFARSIHANSMHYNQQFIAIDCTTFSNEKLMAQLLGYKQGSFSDAIHRRKGVFSGDPVGTIFFDNVENLSFNMQSQLFNMIENSSFQQLQEKEIRLLFASETDLEKRVKSKKFNKDLYERLILFEFYIPPLRDRKDDIPPLCHYFLDKYRQDFQKSVDTISPKIMTLFMTYNFPGNVRELQHIIERAVILSDSHTIELKHMPDRFQHAGSPPKQMKKNGFITLAQMKTQYIMEVLKATNDNKSKTAEILGISRAALWRKLKQMRKKV
jgi:two-component system response regulator AtoC